MFNRLSNNPDRSILYIAFVLIVVVCGCNKKSSISYQDLPEISLTAPSERLNIRLGFPDTIRADIDYGTGGKISEGAYTYRWTVYPKDTVLSVDRPYLTATDMEAAGISGIIACYLQVTDKTSGIQAQALIKALIINPLSEGWTLLCEQQGHTDLGFLNPDGNKYHKFISITDSLGLTPFLSGRPVSLAVAGLSSPGYSSYLPKYDFPILAISTTNQLVFIRGNDFSLHVPFTESANRDLLSSSGSVFFRTGISGVAWKQGNVYKLGVANTNGATPFSPFSAATAINDFNVYQIYRGEHIASSLFPVSRQTVTYQKQSKVLLYDSIGFRFVKPAEFTEGSSVASEYAVLSLNPSQDLSGLSLVYAQAKDYTDYSLFGALMADAKGHFKLLFFLSNGILRSVTDIDDARLGTAKHFAIDFNSGLLLFDSGSQLLGFDYQSNKIVSMLDFPSQKISVLKYETILGKKSSKVEGRDALYQALENKLVLCTYDPAQLDSGGSFYLFDIPISHQKPLEVAHETGFSLIRDVSFSMIP